MSDQPLRQQQQDTVARNQAQRQQAEQQAATDRARLAAFYAANRGGQQRQAG